MNVVVKNPNVFSSFIDFIHFFMHIFGFFSFKNELLILFSTATI